MEILLRYTTTDRVSIYRRFRSLIGAQRFAHKWVGAHPEVGSSYAISDDGVGKITCVGCTLSELFPETTP